MNVVISIDASHGAERAWFNALDNMIWVQFRDFVNALPLSAITDDDFESSSPVVGFSIGQSGSVVICHHQDGLET
jgi:hypothetical protein